MNTHGMTLDFGKHKGELYTRVPVGYLRWMVNAGHKKAEIAKAELDRRGATVHDRKVEISGHAIDSASLRVRKTWHEDRGKDEGLHAWLVRICEKALEEHEIDDKGRIEVMGMRLIFDQGEIYPTLKTVTPLKRKKVKE